METLLLSRDGKRARFECDAVAFGFLFFPPFVFILAT